MPNWLHIDSLATLNKKLLNVVAVLLVVSFLTVLSDWKSGIDILYVDAATGIVATFTAVALLLHVQNNGKH